MLLDLEGLDAAARRLAAAAAAVDRQADRVVVCGRATRWSGAAADAFRAGLGEEVARLRTTADALDEASRALHAHADAVRERLALLTAVRERAEDVAGDLLDDLGGAAALVLGRLP